MAFLNLRNKFSFPVGVTPGFNPLHIASPGILHSGVAAAGGGYTSILTGSVAALSGSPYGLMDAIVGPNSNYNGSSVATFSSFPTAVPDPVTIAAIVTTSSSINNFPNYFINNNASSSTGAGMFSSGSAFYFIWGNTGLNVGPAVSTNTQYFVAFSVSGALNILSYVIVNLANGVVISGTVTPSKGSTIGDGSLYIGNRGTNGRQWSGGIAATMWADNYLSVPELLIWAADPWSFWYPDNMIKLTMVGKYYWNMVFKGSTTFAG